MPLDDRQLRTLAEAWAERAADRPHPSGAGRRWCRLAASAEHDVWLIVWPPGSALGWHGHERSAGALAVVTGEVHEHYRHGRSSGERRVSAGRTVWFGVDHRHAVENDGAVDAVTVHVYSPPLGEEVPPAELAPSPAAAVL